MTNENNSLKEFFTALRISLDTGAMYSPQHPLFLKSLEEVKKKIDIVLATFVSIEIKIAPRYLLIDNLKFEKDNLYEQLAHFLHIRSIKSIKFEQGVEFQELQYFISKMLALPKIILEEGGMRHILWNKNIVHISTVDLDYLDILKSTKGDKDLWEYLLHRAIDNNSLEEIDAMGSNFETMIRSVGIKNLLEAGEFQKLVEDFLTKLQSTNERTFIECVKALYKILSQQPQMSGGVPLSEKLTKFLQSLNAEDFADVLLKQLLEDTSNFTILKLYGQFLKPEYHEKIAIFLGDKITKRDIPQINLEWLEKINKLLGESREDVIRQHYAPAMLECKERFAKEDIFHFARNEIPRHYRAALMALLAQEQEEGWLNLIIDHILMEWEAIPEEEKMSSYEKLFEIRRSLKKDGSILESALQRVDKFIVEYIERCILNDKKDIKLEEFLSFFSAGTLKADTYLDKIFKENDVRPAVLKGFFTLYAKDAALFYQRLERKLSDIQFLLSLIENLKHIPDSSALQVLNNIFLCPHTFVKIEVLKRMQTLPVRDKNFLVSVIRDKSSDASVREPALGILVQDGSLRALAAEILLSRSGPFGNNKNALIENIRMVGRVGLKEAIPFLEHLHQEAFLWWNRKVSQEAFRVLEQKFYGRN